MNGRVPLGPLPLLVLLLATSAGHGATVTYSATPVGGATWEYQYTISNDSLGAPFGEFTVFFDRTLYADLAVGDSPAGWDSIVVQPDLGLPDDGFFDSLAPAGGLGIGASQSGFVVQFSWLGAGAPGAQPFAVVDPSTFQDLETGTTSAVPLPGVAGLLAVALVAAGRRFRRQRGNEVRP